VAVGALQPISATTGSQRARATVEKRVVCLILANDKIAVAIIFAIFIDMMDLRPIRQGMAEHSFCDGDVLARPVLALRVAVSHGTNTPIPLSPSM
jgi:hypothetical protein